MQRKIVELENRIKSLERQVAMLGCYIQPVDQPPTQLELIDQLEAPTSSCDEVMSTSQVLSYLGVSHTTLGRYRAGTVPRGKYPFPRPVSRTSEGKMYLSSEIHHWHAARLD